MPLLGNTNDWPAGSSGSFQAWKWSPDMGPLGNLSTSTKIVSFDSFNISCVIWTQSKLFQFAWLENSVAKQGEYIVEEVNNMTVVTRSYSGLDFSPAIYFLF